MESNRYEEDLSAIRNMMEKSTKFISLSGSTGILAGVYSLIGAYIAYRIIYFSPYILYDSIRENTFSNGVIYLIIVAVLVIVLTLVTGVVLTKRQAKLKGQPIWNNLSQRLLANLFIPLVTGGIVIGVLFITGNYSLLPPMFLIFYGLALVNASHLTVRDVRYLGLTEIVLGLVAMLIPGYGLLFWAIGFGVMHIVYGISMHYKYDK